MGAFATFAIKLVADKTPTSVKYVEDRIEAKLDEAIAKYYMDYNPPLNGYIRTGLLADAPKKGPVSKTGNGAKGDVHMENGGYPTGTWNRFNVIDSADNMLHGGYPLGGGVSVWKQPVEELKGQEYSLWREALIAAGIPVT